MTFRLPRLGCIPTGIGVVVVLALGMGTTAQTDTRANSAAPTNRGWIAYSYRYFYKGGDSGEVFVVRPDGSRRRRVTPLEPWSDDIDPAWSPDGTKIAYASLNASGPNSVGIFTVNADGSDRHRVTEVRYDSTPTWSSSGRIAFVRSHAIWTVNAEGSSPRQLTSGKSDACPSWSSDGRSITFDRKDDIWIMEADGSNAHRFIRGASCASWSPNGRKIAFTGRKGIFVMRVGGIRRERLDPGSAPSWSPDGHRIAFLSSRGEIYVIDANGRNRHRIVRSEEVMSAPSWGRD